MHGYEDVVSALIAAGVDVVFGLMGGGNLRVVTRIEATAGVRYFPARHEAAAVNMADGYARSTGRVGVATVTHGPGLTNAITALAAAARSHTPIVLIVGDVSEDGVGNAQHIDQSSIVQPSGAAIVTLDGSESWALGCERALKTAAEERRPVVLALPQFLQDLPSPEPHRRVERATPSAATVDVSPLEIASAAEVLTASSRVAVLAGRGAVWSNAREPLEKLADLLGAVLVTSLPAKGLFAEHPNYLGVAGGYATPRTRSVLAEADCVIAFGASLNRWTLREGTLFPDARLIHCDTASKAFGLSFTAADRTVVGDAHAVALALGSSVAKAVSLRDGPRSRWRESLSQHTGALEHQDHNDAEGMDPRTAFIALDRLLPRQRTLTVDGGHSAGFPAMYMCVPSPRAFHFTAEFGSIGMSLGTAIGAAVGRPDRLSIAAICDGALMMTLGEIETAVRVGMPMVIVVINDGGYGAEIHKLRAMGLPLGSSVFDNPDFSDVARSLGALGRIVRTTEDLADLVDVVNGLDGPLVIDLRVTRSVMGGWYESAF